MASKSKAQSSKPKVKSSKLKAESQKPKVERKKVESRKLKQPTYKSFRMSKRIKQPKAPIAGAFRLFARSIKILLQNKKLFGGIVIVYLILTIVLVKGFGVTTGIGDLRENVLELFDGNNAQLITGVTLFSVLLGNASSAPSEVAGAYQSMLLIIVSLVLIWALRQRLAVKPQTIRVRDAFYRGVYPLVPFLAILMVIGLQLIPLLVANFLYSIVIVNGLAVTVIEQVLWILLLGLFVLLSFYMVTSSIFAAYIVTLPDMTPMIALRSARELVRHRRFMIMRKILFLPVALLLLAALIVIPLIIISPTVAEYTFFVLSMLGLAIVHSYFYQLYRELL